MKHKETETLPGDLLDGFTEDILATSVYNGVCTVEKCMEPCKGWLLFFIWVLRYFIVAGFK